MEDCNGTYAFFIDSKSAEFLMTVFLKLSKNVEILKREQASRDSALAYLSFNLFESIFEPVEIKSLLTVF